jgi:hypothetical protein
MTEPTGEQPLGAADGEDDKVWRYIDDLKKNPSGETMLYGMVRPAEGDDDGIMFAHQGDCRHWIFIPRGVIQDIRNIGRVQCSGHFHPLAHIQLNAPQSDLEKAFASVANLHQSKLAQYTGNALMSDEPNILCPPGTQLRRDQSGNWVCT